MENRQNSSSKTTGPGKNRVGHIARWDERDIVFAQKDFFRYFGPDSPQYKAYYETHPEHLEYDTKVGNLPGLGRTGRIDTPMFEAQFEAIAKIGSEAFVDGEPAPEKAISMSVTVLHMLVA
jgi:hypothetical protein